MQHLCSAQSHSRLAIRFVVFFVALVGALTSHAMPSAIVYDSNCDSWAPVDRPERLSLAAWNTPVTGSAITLPEPAAEGNGPVSITLSHTTIDDEFSGIVDLTIDGLSLGQSALLEKYKVNNAQGVIDAGAVLVESSRVTDGAAFKAGEVFNFNLIQDVGDRDGRIEVQLDFWEPGSASVAGEYVYRVSSPQASFAPQTARFTVTAATTAQGFNGTVTSGGSPVEGAIVALLDPLVGYGDFIKGATTDAAGAYILHAPNEDEFDIVAFKPGYVGALAVGTERLLGKGETLTANLTLEPGARTVSGTLKDADSGAPLAGVELLFITVDDNGLFDNRLCTLVWTDSAGQFSASVTAARWGALVRRQTAAELGYVHPNRGPLVVVDASAGNVADLELPMTKATSVIWGTLTSTRTDAQGNPVPLGGVEVMAVRSDGGNGRAWGITDGDGDYRLAVTPGRWRVYPFAMSLDDVDHGGSTWRTLSLSGDNQSLEHSFSARPKGGDLFGYVTDDDDKPVGRLGLMALNTDLDNNEGMILSTYQSDGYYCFALPEGEWTVYPVSENAAVLKLLFKNLPRVTMGASGTEEIQGDIDVVTPTATIELTVTGESSNPLTGLLVHGFATVGADEYHAFSITDADGVIRLPAVPGTWLLHVKPSTLAEHGMRELPIIGVNVTGTTALVSRQATPYSPDGPTLAMARREGGAFKFVGSGNSGRVYGIEASTDLKNWFEIGALESVNDSFDVEDLSGRTNVFYRVSGR